MKTNLLVERHAEFIESNFYEWVNELAKEKANVGEILAEVWNQYSENIGNDSIGLLDLTKKEDFGTLFIDGLYLEIAREKGLPAKEERWVMVDNSHSEVKEEDYTFFDENGLINLCADNITRITECLIAWPSLYPMEMYNAIVWPILKTEQIISLYL